VEKNFVEKMVAHLYCLADACRFYCGGSRLDGNGSRPATLDHIRFYENQRRGITHAGFAVFLLYYFSRLHFTNGDPYLVNVATDCHCNQFLSVSKNRLNSLCYCQ